MTEIVKITTVVGYNPVYNILERCCSGSSVGKNNLISMAKNVPKKKMTEQQILEVLWSIYNPVPKGETFYGVVGADIICYNLNVSGVVINEKEVCILMKKLGIKEKKIKSLRTSTMTRGYKLKSKNMLG